ncbi:hypothetical protein LCGC14_2653580 [marine sediment metagenome]|uniref:Uncharacterized protein n=1 Tax=marine sediment metagenome TaxID=412755 RepID=A0A0F9AGG9_9ZZZZ
MSKYPCYKSETGFCKYGGNKSYDYGFVSGTASYCKKAKKWVADLEKCPLSTISAPVSGD